MTTLSDGDEDLHYGNGTHRRRPPRGLPDEAKPGWRVRAKAHDNTHKARGDEPDPEPESEDEVGEATVEIWR